MKKKFTFVVLIFIVFQFNSLFSQTTYKISGKTLDTLNRPIPGATVSLLTNLGSSSKITDTAGYYEFDVPAGMNCTLSASKVGFNFFPASKVFTAIKANQTQNFIGRIKIIYYKISGAILDSVSNRGIGGVIIYLVSDSIYHKMTDSTGTYFFNVPAGRDYTIAPQKTDYVFYPTKRTYTQLNAEMKDQNFLGKYYKVPQYYKVSGIVVDSAMRPISEVKINITGDSNTIFTTTSTGIFAFNLRVKKNYTITPTKQNFAFTPQSRSITSLSAETAGQNFLGMSLVPPTPKLVSPINNSINQYLILKLEWGYINLPVFYHIQVSSDSLFGKRDIEDSVTVNYLITRKLDIGKKYFWRVRAISQVKGAWSNVWSFSTINFILTTPRLISPTNYQFNISTSPMLNWQPDSNAQYYHVIVAKDSLFSNIIVNDSLIRTNNYSLSNLSNTQIYFWKVQSKAEGMVSPWSGMWRFSTNSVILATPTLVSPINNAVNQTDRLQLKWNPVLNSTIYLLQISVDSSFKNELTSSIYTDTIAKIIGPLQINKKYFWRVRATNSSGISLWSTSWNFTTGIIIPLPPKLISPEDMIVDLVQPITLTWKKDSNAISYHLQVSKNGMFNDFIINDSNVTNFNYILTTLPTGVKYCWRVSTKNAFGKSAWSNIWRFSIKSDIPDGPVLNSPQNNAVNQPYIVSFTWSEITGALNYQISISTDSLFKKNLYTDSSLISNSVILGPLEQNKKYYWFVRANLGYKKTQWSKISQFTTKDATLQTPNLKSPVNLVTLNPYNISFDWDPVQNATKYEIQISLDTSFRNSVFDSIISNNSLKSRNLPMGMHFNWRVRAMNETEISSWSQNWSFTTNFALPEAPILIFPIKNMNNIFTSTKLVWTSVLGAIKYYVRLSTDSTFSSTILNDSNIVSTSVDVDDLENGQKYFWQVKAFNNSGQSKWSNIGRFQVITVPPSKVSLIQPSNGATDISLNNMPAVMWNSSSGAKNYWFQAALDGDFVKLIKSRSIKDTSIVFEELQPATTYYWRILAFNDAGKSEWSDTWQFTSAMGNPTAPIIVLPSNEAISIDTAVVLKWIQKSNVRCFSLEVSKNSDYSNPFVYEMNYLYTTKRLTKLKYATTYYWRVKAFNSFGESDWVVSKFTTIASPTERKNWTVSGKGGNRPTSINTLSSRNGFTYAGADSGIYYMSNTQKTWLTCGKNWNSVNNISKIIITSDNNVLASAVDGLWKLNSNYDSWNLAYMSTENLSLAVDNNDIIYAFHGTNVMISSDRGESWNSIADLPLFDENQIPKVVHLAPNKDIYIGTAKETENSILGPTEVFQSKDGGYNWQSLGFNNRDNQAGVTSIHSNSKGDIYISTEGLSGFDGGTYKYSNGIWEKLNLSSKKVTSIIVLPNGDLMASAINDNQNGSLSKRMNQFPHLNSPLDVSKSGITKSKDGGKNWEQVNDGLVDNKVTTITTTTDGQILTGTYDGGVFEGSYRSSNQPPYFVNMLNDTSIYKNQTLELIITASDENMDKLYFNSFRLPTGASLDSLSPATRKFSWTPAQTQIGSFKNILFTVSDGSLMDSMIFNIDVLSTTSQPYFTLQPKDTVIKEDNILRFNISAVDPNGNSLTFSNSGFPDNARLDYVDQNTRAFYWKPDYGSYGVYEYLTVNISNGMLSDSVKFNITVQKNNRKPARFTLISPGKKDTLNLVYPESPVIFKWNSSFDPDTADRLIYKMNIKGQGLDTTYYDLENSEVLLNIMKKLKPKKTYTWFATVSDGSSLVNSDTLFFNTSANVTGMEHFTIPKEYSLSQNYPNPFNPITTIRFSIPHATNITVEIYNILGQRVRTLLLNEYYEPGIWQVFWDGKNDRSINVSSGIYFYRLNSKEFISTKKMILMK